MESDTSGANTLYHTRYPEGFALTKVPVESFDFSSGSGRNFPSRLNVIRILGVEGAEFPCPHECCSMHAESSRWLYVEFHPWLPHPNANPKR